MLTKLQKQQIEQTCEDHSPYYVLDAVSECYSSVRKMDVINYMIERLSDEGYLTIKPSNLIEQEKVENFILELKPHYNERQYLFI